MAKATTKKATPKKSGIPPMSQEEEQFHRDQGTITGLSEAAKRKVALNKRRQLASAKGLKCQEAAPGQAGGYIPCSRGAEFIIRNSDSKQYAMCAMCADHNIKNRGASMVYEDEKFGLADMGLLDPNRKKGAEVKVPPGSPELNKALKTLDDKASNGTKPGKTDDAPHPANKSATIIKVDEAKLAMYVADGMAKFKTRLTADLEEMVIATRAASSLAHSFSLARQIKDTVSEALDIVKAADAKLAKEVVPQAFEREKIKGSITTVTGWRVTPSTRFVAGIIPDMKEEAKAWLRKNDLGDLISDTVNAQTLSAAGKQMLTEGKELPESLFRTHYEPNTSLTKIKT